MDRRREFTDARVAEFIRRYHAYVREDPDLGSLYGSCVTDWPAHSARLAAYWGPHLRHEEAPEFPALTTVRFGMDAEMLERWLALWNRAADEVFSGPAAEAVQQAGAEIAEEHMVGRVIDE
jgi:hemoglobin